MTVFLISLIKVLYFFDPHCPDCDAVKENVLPQIEKLSYVEIIPLSVEKIENMKLLMEIEDEHRDYDNAIPVAVVGDKIFGNREEIEEGLIKYLMSLNPERSINVKTEIEKDTLKLENPVYALYFYSNGCLKCSKVDLYLKALEKEFPILHIKRMDVLEHGGVLLSIEKRLGIDKDKYLVTPVVILDTLVFFQSDIHRLRDAIVKTSKEGGNLPFWQNYREEKVYGLLKGMKATGVFLAGLIDGINPCAFAVLIFLMAFLSMRGGRREILWGGIPFIIAVYITYLSIGMGLFSFFRGLEGVKNIGKAVYIMSGIFALVLGILSFRDAILYRNGRDMALQMPERFKKLVKGTIRKGFGKWAILFAGLLIGFLVTLFEFTCTGQVYFPVLAYLAKDPMVRMHVLKMLFIYNIGFIIPAIIVFSLALFGFGQREFNRFLIKRVVFIKALTGTLLLGIGTAVLIYSI